MLRSLSLLIMRIGTGMLLVIWGALRFYRPGTGTGLSEKYYGGMAAASDLQLAFAAAEILIGVLVVLGLFRRYALIAQALILVGGAVPIWKHYLDPFGVYLHDDANILFFPSITVAAAALALIAFREFDRLALDRVIYRNAT